ncbi:MAG: SgcJ/EcaC family oxidoreductase [Ramlibacter sp.]
MRKFILAMLLAASLGPAWAGPEEEAMDVLQHWTQAFTNSDVDSIVKLYAPDALFFGTGSKTLVTSPADVRIYFEQALLNNRPRTATLDQRSVKVLADTVVVVSGLDTVTGTRDGATIAAKGRVTFVVAKRLDGWRIVQFHRSALPN